MDVGGCRNREVDRSSARQSATLGDRRRESAPLACHGRVDRERVEGSLDDAESLRTQCPLVRVRRDQGSKVKLRQGSDADGALEFCGDPGSNQHGGVEEDAAHA